MQIIAPRGHVDCWYLTDGRYLPWLLSWVEQKCQSSISSRQKRAARPITQTESRRIVLSNGPRVTCEVHAVGWMTSWVQTDIRRHITAERTHTCEAQAERLADVGKHLKTHYCWMDHVWGLGWKTSWVQTDIWRHITAERTHMWGPGWKTSWAQTNIWRHISAEWTTCEVHVVCWKTSWVQTNIWRHLCWMDHEWGQ